MKGVLNTGLGEAIAHTGYYTAYLPTTAQYSLGQGPLARLVTKALFRAGVNDGPPVLATYLVASTRF